MRHKKYVRLGMVLMIVVLALMVFVPAAFAGRITRIMYGQASFDTYMYKPSTVSNLFIEIGWGTGAPVFPNETVNALLQTSDGGTNPYEDQDDTGLYEVYTNPTQNVKSFVTVANQEYWIGVEPYVGDTTYTLRVWLTKRGAVNPAGTWYGKDGTGTPEATIDKTVTGNAYATDGEFYKDGSTCTFYNVGQYWPGTMAAPITNWNLYVCERGDYISGAWPAYDYPMGWESNTAKLYSGGPAGSTSVAEYTLNNSDPGDYGNELDTWFAVDPQTWSTATNVGDPWTGRGVPAPSANFTYYPKPKSYTWLANAPLWMTYSFTDNVMGADKPGYMWANVPSPLASKRSFMGFDWTSSTKVFSWRYQGPAFSWTFPKGPRAGIWRVRVDGAEVTPTGFPNPDVDQFNATVTYGNTVSFNVGGTATAWHNVEVWGTGRSNSTSSPKGFFLYHDKFSDPDDVTPAAENNYDGMTAYRWSTVTGLGGLPTPPSGGGFVSTKSNGCATAFTFQTVNAIPANRTIKWQYVKGPRGGIQNVYIDGQFVGTVDQNNATVQYQQSTTWVDGGTYAGKVLSLGQNTWHTIFIVGSGSTNSTTNPKGYWIYSDMFQVEGGTPVEAE